MQTKLTLSLDEGIINIAKKFAGSNHTSVSKIVSDYFSTLSNIKKSKSHSSPVLNEISGILNIKKSNLQIQKDYKKHLEEKYQ